MSEFTSIAPTESAFRARTLSPKDMAASKEFGPIASWYKESCKKLPEMRVTMTPVKETKNAISNPAFFSYVNVDVTTPLKSWQQGGIMQRGDILPTTHGETITSHGSAILLVDRKGNTFVTVSQEPMAPARHRTAGGTLLDKSAPGAVEIHPVVRTPLQTSAEKLKRIIKNEHEGRAADSVMTNILYSLARDRNQTISDVVSSVPLSPSMTDGNRMQSDILYGTLSVTDKEAQEISKLAPSGHWTTPKELDALTVMGATNGTLNIARNISEAQRHMTKKRLF